jgi:hypothetical protein
MAREKKRPPTVCIVVPCYRPTLRPFEELALRQCTSILSAHDTFFVKPSSLDLTGLTRDYGIPRVESFADRFFEGVAGYNQLMLSDEFYARFAQYDYMLIYQLDAFVFRDELLAWCERGHDYIGAPWLPDAPAPSRSREVYVKARQYAYRWANKIDPASNGAHKAQYMYAVGNGGFSLRRISAMRAVLKAMPSKVDAYCRLDGKVHHEDMFFSIEANRYFPRVKLPSFREAAGFAWELQPGVARALNKGQLPFGCHGWNKLHRDEWRAIFAGLGHSIDELLA